MEITAFNGQSIFDIAVQYGGSVEAVFEIAAASDISITDELTMDRPLTMDSKGMNPLVSEYFRTHRLYPATGDVKMGEGIEFWAIEYDFLIDN
jgi:hypothetical protein